MNVTVEKIPFEKKPVLGAMLRTMKHREDEPAYAYPHFDDYWPDEGRGVSEVYIPYFICADGEIAGFVLLDKYFWVLPPGKTNYGVAELYIKPEFRLKGIGRAGMFLIFEGYPGNWEIRPLDCSKDAQAFWERTIGDYTRENYRTTCFGKYKRPIYTLQAPAVVETGHEIIYREAYMG